MATSSDSLDLSDLSMPESTVEVTDGLRSVILNDEQTLKKELNSLECPFTWTDYRSKGLKREWSIDSKLRKIDENQEDKEFPWYTFNLNVLLCYEYCRKKSYSEALKALTFCEELITSTDSKGIYENLYQSTKDALFHVVLSSKCHVYFAMGQLNEMTHLLKQVCSYKEMGDASKAAIWGIRALVAMEYGYNGTKDAVEFLKTATEMDSEQAEWPFLHAKCLSRTRRLENFVMIPEMELDLLAKAAETTNNPNYVIFLAQAYREKSFRMFCWASKPIDQKLKKELDLMARRSYDLYRKALELRPDWGNINIRCAQGFSRLPPPYRDYKLAKECCEKALMLMPENEMVLHVKAQLCERIDNDMNNAKKYYKLAAEGGVYGACMDLLRINYNEDKTYDPIPELNNILERFIEKPLKEDILCQMGSYYFFVKDDLLEAYQYWYKVIDDNPHSEKLKTLDTQGIPLLQEKFTESRARESNPGPPDQEASMLNNRPLIKQTNKLPLAVRN
ncbi:uncharacterized protein [Periplaneta americana]|uniref:uncharacterized protein isoform X2 n=1 Tax=Periplaneta americana TaxID=6978 RepID=UPI0037E98857